MAEDGFAMEDILDVQPLSEKDRGIAEQSRQSLKDDDSLRIDLMDNQTNTSASNPSSDLKEASLFIQANQDDEVDRIVNENIGDPAILNPYQDFSDMVGGGTASYFSDAFLGAVAGVGGGLINVAASLEEGTEAMLGAVGVDVDMPVDKWADSYQKSVEALEHSAINPLTMQMSRNALQFLTGFWPAFRVVNGLKKLQTSSRVTKTIIADGLAGGVAFNPDDPNANALGLITQIPGLKEINESSGGAISDFLMNNPDDPDAVKRLRNGVSGIIEGRIMDGFVAGVKYLGKKSIAYTKRKLGFVDDFIGPKLGEGGKDQVTHDTLNKEIYAGEQELKEYENLSQREGIQSHEKRSLDRIRLETKRKIEAQKIYQKRLTGSETIADIKSALRAENVAVDETAEKAINELMTKELPEKLGKKEAKFNDDIVEFPDDVTKALYIAKEQKFKESGYMKFLEDEVGLDPTEIKELSGRIVNDLNSGQTVGTFSLYRDDLKAAIELGDVPVTVKQNDLIARAGIKTVPMPTSTADQQMVTLLKKTEETLVDPDSNIKPFLEQPQITKTIVEGEEREFRYNLGTVKTPEDFQNLFDWLKIQFAGDTEKAAGKRINLQDEINLALQRMPEILSSNNPSEIIKAMGVNPQAVAIARVAHSVAFKNLAEWSTKVIDTTGKEVKEARNKLREALAFWYGLKNIVVKKAREAGQSTRMMGHPIAYDMLNTDAFDKVLEASVLNTGLTPGSAMNNIAKMIKQAENPVQLEGTLEAITEKSGLTDILMENYMAWGMLSGKGTHTANLIGGTLIGVGTQPAEHYFKNLWKRALGLEYKDQASREYAAGLIGLLRGTQDTLEVFLKTLWHDKPVGFAATKLEGVHDPKFNAIKLGVEDATESRVSVFNFLGRLNRGGMPLLLATDDAVRSGIHRMNVSREAFRQAREENLEPATMVRREEFLRQNPQYLKNYHDIKLKSTQLGDEATLTEELGRIGSTVQHINRQFPLAKIFNPFVKVLVNMADFAIKRDPINNTLRTANPFSNTFRNKNWDDLDARAEFLSRMTTGTMLLMSSSWAALNGYITGTEEADYEKEKNKNMINYKPHSIRIHSEDGSVTNVDYSRLEPYSKIFQWGADIVKIAGMYEDDEVASEIIYQISHSLQDILISDNWAPGLAELMSLATQRPKDKEHAERAISKVLEKIASGFTPSILREEKNASDQRILEKRGGELNLTDDKFAKYGAALRGQQSIQKLLDRAKGNLPGYSNNIPAMLDRWGNIMLRAGDRTTLTPLEYITQFNVYRKNHDDIDKRIEELELIIGEPSENITVPDFPDFPVRISKRQLYHLKLLERKDLTTIQKYVDKHVGDDAKIPPSLVDELVNVDEYAPGSIKSEVLNIFINIDRQEKLMGPVPFSGKEGQRTIIKSIWTKRRAKARGILLDIQGNEELILAAKEKSDIAKENPREIFK
jgi:hypothetical protein